MGAESGLGMIVLPKFHCKYKTTLKKVTDTTISQHCVLMFSISHKYSKHLLPSYQGRILDKAMYWSVAVGRDDVYPTEYAIETWEDEMRDRDIYR